MDDKNHMSYENLWFLFLLFTSTFSRVLQIGKKRICYRLSHIELESTIQNLERNPTNLIKTE